MAPALTLFLIIFIEGYIVLSAELMAIRLIIPYTGSGTDTISIIIAAVLMPLAFGYFAGGRFKPKKRWRHVFTVRRKLLRNLSVAAAILTLGLSYVFLQMFFENIYFHWGWRDRILLTTLYAALFLVYPVFLLGQTVPLVSNFFSRARLSHMAGKILFFSTLGSFMGAVFCTLVLMAFLGVHHAVSITIGCMFVLALILSKKLLNVDTVATGLCLILSLVLNSSYAMKKNNIVANNKYHMIQVTEQDWNNSRHFRINHGNSSGLLVENTEPLYDYAVFIEDNFITPMSLGDKRSVLVVGAGGFTLGRGDNRNEYVFIDIDPELQKTAEEHFLPEKLGKNKTYIPEPARAFLYSTDQKFDLVILDVFRGLSGSPEHLVTQEFFQQIKDVLKEDGIVVGNYVISANFGDEFSIRLENTIRSVFPHTRSQIVQGFDGWDKNYGWINAIYTMYNTGDDGRTIYTDDKNSSMFDKGTTMELYQ